MGGWRGAEASAGAEVKLADSCGDTVCKDDGKVGVGYAEVLQVVGQPPVEDEMERERHAASARLDCYRYFPASGLPADGGKPALAPRL